jgi:hypothetical protein
VDKLAGAGAVHQTPGSTFFAFFEQGTVTESESSDSWSASAPDATLGSRSRIAREAFRMLFRKGRHARAQCDHAHTVTVRNAGIERSVCETCGHVSFRAEEGLSGNVERRKFEREVERERA